MYNIITNQTQIIFQQINKTINSLLLFFISLFVSIFFGIWYMDFVVNLFDTIIYAVGIIVPLMPTILSMERWWING